MLEKILKLEGVQKLNSLQSLHITGGWGNLLIKCKPNNCEPGCTGYVGCE